MTVLVTGATGTVGREIVRQLHDTGTPVRALSRAPGRTAFPGGVEVAYGDLADPATLTSALDGTTALHLITFAGHGYAPLAHPERIVAAARAAGVGRITVLSGMHTGPVEHAVSRSALSWSILDPVEFMSNALWDWAPAIRTGQAVRVAFPWMRSPKVHPADIAAVAVEVLRHGGHDEKTLRLTGPEALTPGESLSIIGSVTRKPIDLVELDRAQSYDQLGEEGFTPEDIDAILGTEDEAAEEGAPAIAPTVTEVTGQPARTFRQWVTENADAFR